MTVDGGLWTVDCGRWTRPSVVTCTSTLEDQATDVRLAMQGLVHRPPSTVYRPRSPSTGPMISSATVPHFDIPLDLPHAGRIADRILVIVQRHAEEKGVEAPEAIDAAERLWSLL